MLYYIVIVTVTISPMHQRFSHTHDLPQELFESYRFLLQKERVERLHRLRIVDVGTGRKGIARLLLQNAIAHDDSLELYDPQTPIAQPGKKYPNVHVTDAAALEHEAASFDVVSLSFVLCCKSDAEQISILRELREKFPKASLFLLEYILQGRHDVHDILRTDHAAAHQCDLTNQEFSHLHSRFTLASLVHFVEEQGWNVNEICDLYHQKALLTCNASSTITPQNSRVSLAHKSLS